MSPDNSLDQHVVTAVLVAHDGAGWLPHVAEGVLQQTRPVQRAVGVDTGSLDRSGAMLAGLFGRPAVFGMDRGTGYAAAVTQALRHRAANTHLPGPHGERTEWVWLIHDDCEPAPDALELLLRAAAGTPGAAVLGPKVMDWNDRRVILEAGITIDRAGRRITGVEPREMDQGQHDGERDVLAVSSAGMLIRRDVWDQLGGFDTSLRLFREDVDFCWRAQAAGYRVRLVTDAVVYHLEASARNRRQASAAPRTRQQDRRSALVTLLGNLPAGHMLRVLAGNVVLSALRTLFYLAAKRPGAGVDEFAALSSVALHPLRLLRIRRSRARGRRAAYGRLRPSIPPGRTLTRLAEFLAAAWSRSSPVDTVGSHHATEDPSDDDSLLIDSGLAQRILTSPGVLLFTGLTVVALVAERSLLGGGALGGGELTPAWGGASGLWQEYLQGFHPAGVGSAAGAPPYVAVLAVVATLLLGKTWLAVDVLLIGCVPLAGLTAYLAVRRVTRFAPVRVWAAAAYALLPVGMGAVAAGRLGSAVVFVLLPLAGLLAARIFTQPRRRARRAAWALALITALAAAFVPVTWLIVAVLAGLGGLAFGRSRPGMALNLAIVAAVPPVLLLPWSLRLATHPAWLFLESGLHQPGLSQAVLPARSLLLLSPGGPGLPPFWVTGGLLAVALVTVTVSGRRPAVLAGWGVAVIGLLAAVGVSDLLITPAGAARAFPAWPGVLLAIAGAGLVLAVAAAGDALPGLLGGSGWRGPAGLGVLVLALVACSAPAVAAASWVLRGVTGPVTRIGTQVLPEFVSVAASAGNRPRTLVLRTGPHGSVSYEVLRDRDPLIGATALTPPPSAKRVLTMAVAALTAPSGGEAQDQGKALASLGIGYVLLPAAPGSPALAQVLSGVAGLRPVSQTAAFQLWQVAGTVARVRVVKTGGAVVPVRSGSVGVSGAPAPAAGGELVLAEPVGGWSASLNGRPLQPLPAPVDGWAQGFRLPAGGGTLTIRHSQLERDAVTGLQLLAVLAVALLALPGARLAGEEPGEAAADSRRRPAGGRGRGGTGDRQPGHRGRGATPVPEPGGSPEDLPDQERLAAPEPAAVTGYQPAQTGGGRFSAARAGQPAGASPAGPPWADTDAGSGDHASVARYPDDPSGSRAGAAGLRDADPDPAGSPAGRRRDPAGTADAGGQPRKRPGGLLRRARAGRSRPEAPAGPAGPGTWAGRRPGRGGKGQAAPEAGAPGGRFRGDTGEPPGAPGGGRPRPGSGPYPGRGPGPGSGPYPGRGPGPGERDSYGSGGYPAGDYRTGDYPDADDGRAGGRSGGFPAGGYRAGGESGRTGRSAHGRPVPYGPGDDAQEPPARGGRRAASRPGGGFPAAGTGGARPPAAPGPRGGGAGEYPAGGGRGGYRGYPPADHDPGGYGEGAGYRAGSGRWGSGGSGPGGPGAGPPDSRGRSRPGRGYRDGYPDADHRTGGYPAGSPREGHRDGYPEGDYPPGGYPAGEYATGGYPAGDYATGYGDPGYGGGAGGRYRDGEDTSGAADGRGEAGRGRRWRSPGRRTPGRGKPGRRPGREDR